MQSNKFFLEGYVGMGDLVRHDSRFSVGHFDYIEFTVTASDLLLPERSKTDGPYTL